MNLLKKLAQDSFWLLLARIGAQGSMVIVTYLLAWRLGAAGFGEYAFMATAIVIGNTLTAFGSDMALIREIAAKDDFSNVLSVLILQLFLSFVFIGFVFLIAPSFPNQTSGSILSLKVYSFALIPLAFFTVFTSILRGVQRMTAYAWLNLGIALLQVVVIAIFVQRGTKIVTLAYVLLGVQSAGTILAGILCLPLISNLHHWNFSLDKLISLFALCLPIGLIAILGILYQKMSLAMLSFLGTSVMVGLFSAAARVMEAARIGHIAVFTALYPAMAQVNWDAQKTFRFSWIALLLISVTGSFLLFILAKPIVVIFFGAEYQLSIVVMKILAFTLVPYTVNSYLSLMFLAQKREGTVLRISGISLLLILLLDLWLIPRTGLAGASWAALIVESIQAILFLWVWMRNPSPRADALHTKGVSYELSDLS
jgi:O-antigen/teichoic acid export membrane protein